MKMHKELILDAMKHQMNSKKYNIYSSKLKRFKDVDIFESGNFLAVVLKKANGKISIGIAKRNPIDAYNSEIGLTIATTRALSNRSKILRKNTLETLLNSIRRNYGYKEV